VNASWRVSCSPCSVLRRLRILPTTVEAEAAEEARLETVYDWITVAIFGGLVVLFLHRSMAEGEPQDTILHYLPPAVGCALANYVGNHGQGPLSALIVVAVLAYVALVLKPFGGLKF
jgi:hypothetical protein